MTALNISTHIPSQIDTLEKLVVWGSLALANINPDLTAIEGVGYTERVSQAGIFYVQADNKYRALLRNSIQMSPDYLAGGAKLWTYAQPLSNTAIPAIFIAN
ncbi:glucose-6-phosphate dehydrogenase [Calothrix sp. FACHB-1219]|uniref:glucose-6-phosphate dehydrogenase n=1 Tax=unclassified Calothrix TaxID=2619626 RepID=UPI0016860DAD|nr:MULTISPECIES: glucose-6-phosphate dehydrogenase [unclassified Calothrix]MBD2202749.1 glucose-6-phosphate dehydrogenase [Calothrix sp. FACHB-168]MBD2218902.1 glucose-6-phosphate dehydrogenase [Calothrix sp. FACHB-1219]